MGKEEMYSRLDILNCLLFDITGMNMWKNLKSGLCKNALDYSSESLEKHGAAIKNTALAALFVLTTDQAIAQQYTNLRITNKIEDDSTAVKYGKALLLDKYGTPQDSIILDENGAGTFDNVLTDIAGVYELPRGFVVYQNYPNPFNPSTRITFDVSRRMPVWLDISSSLGQSIKDVKIDAEPGRYVFEWGGDNNNGNLVASGPYFVVVRSPEGAQGIKMSLIGHGSGSSRIYSEGAGNLPNKLSANKSSSLDDVMYMIHFENTDSTQPRIKEWTTDLFGVYRNMDTTFYSERATDNVIVSGVLLDALTMTGVDGAKIRIRYNNTNMVDSTTTASGSYSLTFQATSGPHSFRIEAEKPNWYSYRENTSTTANQLVDTLYTFEKFRENHNWPVDPPQDDPRRDGLAWIKYMHAPAWQTDTVFYVDHWRTQDLPLSTYINIFDNPSQASIDSTRNGINHLNSSFSRFRMDEVTSTPTIGLEINYDIYGNAASIRTWQFDINDIPLYPLKGGITLAVDNSGNPEFDLNTVLHEIGHIILCGGRESPFFEHITNSSSAGALEFAPFEKRAINILYNLPNTADKKYNIYDPTTLPAK
jgi:hypothetical protein